MNKTLQTCIRSIHLKRGQPAMKDLDSTDQYSKKMELCVYESYIIKT